MMVSFFRKAAARRETRCGRRLGIARTPRVESLEERKLPAYLTLPVTHLPTFAATVSVPQTAASNTFNVQLSGGNFLGTYIPTPNTTAGTTTLASSYGLNFEFPPTVGITYYSTTSTRNGLVYGNSVPNAGAIAWLVVNRGPTATTPVLQNALQAAIWRTEFGNNFQLNGADNNNIPSNSPALITAYQADLAALDGNTLPVGDVMWISPYSTGTLSSFQAEGLVALPTAAASTQTNVSISTTSTVYGQPVTFGAVVTSGGGTPTGAVQFQVDGANVGSPVPLSAAGTANLTETTVNAGKHVIGAVYEPSGSTFGLSASPNNLTLTINPVPTQIVFRALPNPAKKNRPVTVVATVQSVGSSAIPLGTLVFTIDGAARPAVNLFNGNAVRKHRPFGPGKHIIGAIYTPTSSNFLPSQGMFVLKVHH
jgi:hypothetical protein